MKRIWKIILCFILILLVFIEIAAKYHTWGVHIGQEVSVTQPAYLSLPQYVMEDSLLGIYNCTWICKNAFGRTIIVHESHPEDAGYKQFGKVVKSVRTLPNMFAVATHLDFLHLFVDNNGSFEHILTVAGHPVELEKAYSMADTFLFKTLDGYVYGVMLRPDDSIRLEYVITPGGERIFYSDLGKFTRNVILSYLALAAILAAFAAALLIFQKKRNKRLESILSAD